MTWPTDRPGYPLHAERDGWHWLKHPEDLRPFPSAWNAELRGWPSGGVHSPQGVVDLGFDYISPCYTQADLDAAVQAERDAIAEMVGKGCLAPLSSKPTLREIHAAIRARGPTSALDAAVAKARAEGMEAALEIARPKGLVLKSAQQIVNEIEAAIRSAAAGEEGK